MNYIASIMNDEGTGLVEVDLRTLETDRLRLLRTEAEQHGDGAMADAIYLILRRR